MWQMAQAAVLFPEVLWEKVPDPCQSVGWALAAVWQVEQAVGADPPLKLMDPGCP